MNAPPKIPPTQAAFVTGSTFRHVVVMTATGGIGLMAIFAVDLLSLLYISWLGNPSLTAGVGFATLVLFFTISINVGLMIAVSALVSRALGAGDWERARRLTASSMVIMCLAALVVSALGLLLGPWLLGLIGAKGETLAVAERFLHIVLPSNILMGLGMGLSGVLRAVGDARRAMYVTLSGGLVTVGLDPLLIFGAGLGVDGAAIATVVSRTIFALVGLHGVVKVHNLMARPHGPDIMMDARPMLAIALPAILTNVATPVANTFFAHVIADFGDKAVAASAIIDRLVPVAFGALFALSGAIGPILGQNWGAMRFDRMRKALQDAYLFAGLYVGVTWAILALGRYQIAHFFGVTGLAADVVMFFCVISGPMWLFFGLLFVANAAFNNLGAPLLSTAFNWGRATLGTIPFAFAGAAYAGPQGAIAGVAVGGTLFGIGAAVMAFWVIKRLENKTISKT